MAHTKQESIQHFNEWAKKITLDIDAQRENQHKWIYFVITLSSAIFEFIGASLLDYMGIKHLILLYLSMILFAMNVCIGLWFSKRRIEKNVDILADEYVFVDELRSKVLMLPDEAPDLSNIIYNELKKRKENQDKEIPDKKKRDYSMDILVYFFYGGIILMIGSFITCQ